MRSSTEPRSTHAQSPVESTPSHWSRFHRHWNLLKPPLRPDESAVSAFARETANRSDRVLLLGVTPELGGLGKELVAVDRSAEMIANVWRRGNSAHRSAVRADWLALPLAKGRFTAAVGDGSLNAVLFPRGHRSLYEELAAVLVPGGVFVCRLFATPADQESFVAVKQRVLSGHVRSFHAFKWHVAMARAMATGDANVAVSAIRDDVNRMFPDRVALATATGWAPEDLDTIDVYRNSREVYSFPTLDQFRAVIPASFRHVRIVAAGSYELAGRCPLLVMERAR
jgi:SAM-dependent methyltransferase